MIFFICHHKKAFKKTMLAKFRKIFSLLTLMSSNGLENKIIFNNLNFSK